jgi:hypothetical protein
VSLREKILSAEEPTLKLAPVDVPEWGCSVWMKGWSGKEREQFEKEFGDLENAGANVRARVLVRILQNEDGSRIFTDADADALGDKLSGPIGRLFGKVMDLSGLRAETLETTRKN